MSRGAWLGALLVCALPRLVLAQQNGLLLWEYPVAVQGEVAFVATLVRTDGGQQTVPITPVARPECQDLAAEHGQPWTEETLCAVVCTQVGATAATLVAQRGEERSEPSNVAHATLPGPCPPPPPPTPPTPLPPWAIGAGAVAISGAVALAGDSTPTFPELVNRSCVSWKLTGPCLCNPFTPCVRVEYFEPAYLIEIVKQPGTTAIPLLGTFLKAGLEALGVSLFGGGGAGNSAGAGHINLQYAEAHVWSWPQILGGPCTACLPVNALPVLHYASEADAAAWRTTTAPPGLPPLPVGTWGPLFPRVGFAIQGSAPIASGLQAFRALNIAFIPATPVPPEVHVILAPTDGLSTCMQMASPKQTPCFPPGTPGLVWEQGATSAKGSYIWIVWKKRTCCVEPPRATCGITTPGIGLHGENLCPL